MIQKSNFSDFLSYNGLVPKRRHAISFSARKVIVLVASSSPLSHLRLKSTESATFEITPGRFIGGTFPCFVIAEIGQNHQGKVEVAKQLINIAAECGVDCVKFQKSDLRSRFSKEVLGKPYKNNNSWGATYGEHRKKIELSEENFMELKNYSDRIGICFSASGMDIPSIEFLSRLDVPFFKIGSADTTNLPLIRFASKYGKPLVISTGMTDEKDVCRMFSEISKTQKCIALLQCTSCYPTLPQYVNLRVLKTYRELFPEAVIGYSGHELGTVESLAAVACGAKVLERHITLDHSLKGSDHVASLNPQELKNFINEIRIVEKAMGSSTKQVQYCELPCYEKDDILEHVLFNAFSVIPGNPHTKLAAGKTIVAAKYIKKGSILDENMIEVKVSTIKGFDPISYDTLIGKKLKRDLDEDATILFDDVL